MSRVSHVVAFLSAVLLLGCTSLLGDFTSGGAAGDDGGGGGGEGGGIDSTTGEGGPAGEGGNNTDATADGPGADGADSAVCVAGEKRCVGNSVETCASGQWGASVACPQADPYCNGAGVCGACVGVCQGACTPGTTTCSTSGPQVCGTNGAWGQPTPCGAHQACTGGGSAGPATCTCTVDPTCSAAGLACENGTTLATCGQDSMGCWYPASTATCTNGACFGTAPNGQCCTNACTLNATRCGGAGLEQCTTQGNGCTAWNAGTACGAHQSCTTSGSTSSCTCVADPLCTSTANECSGSNAYVTCAQDTQGCYYQSGTNSCGANSTCTSGACQCSAGFTPCNGACVNINTDSNNCGGCGHVCPALTAPSFGSTCGLITAGHCAGYVGGYVSAGGGPLLSNADGSTVVAVRATMPNVAGTLYAVGALVGSNDSSGTTQMIYGLYNDSGGSPNLVLFYTNYNDTSLQFSDPSGLIRLTGGGGLYYNGFNNALAANTTYWVYMKAGVGGTTGNIAGTSSSPCVAMNWINVDAPGTFTAGGGGKTCAGDYNLYMVVSFP
ncbi:MAG TPA: hypothetical protein VIF09_19255 [Polyangiaceae bacterium]